MGRHSRHSESSEDLNIWSAFTDLMSNAFIILSLFLLLTIVRSVLLKSASEATETRVIQLNKQVANLQKELQQKNNQVTELEVQINRLKSPPLIVIRDSQERKFESGSAELSKGLRRFIEADLVNKIEGQAKEYNGYVVEVIGHTDGQVNNQSFSNLDEILEKVASGSEPISNLKPGSNADLGLMRALAVVKVLQDIQRSRGRLKGLKFRAYSAAQLFLPQQGGYAPINRNSDETRRRIEIRFTPPGKVQK